MYLFFFCLFKELRQDFINCFKIYHFKSLLKPLYVKHLLNLENTKKKRPMGDITHLINQFKSKNTFDQSYDFILTFIWREENQ